VAVYRIVMEAINNALRHAKARKVIVEIRAESKNLMVEVRDDGIGLAPEAVAGVGLASMRERAEELGGHFAILPNLRGLHLQAVLPLVKE
jgi:two-component system NarL family sensor kinase